MFERLTEKGCKFLTPANASKNELLDEIKRHQKYYDRLAAYEDSELSPEELQELAKAKSDGRLVVLPVKVGDTVHRKGRFSNTIVEAEISQITINRFGISMVASRGETTHFHFDDEDIGERVFLTQEAAEKALAVME